MKNIYTVVLLSALLLLSACAGPRKPSQREILRQELLKWESFDSQGIVEISYMGLSLRKMFSAAKNGGELRLDVFDGGIMGAGAAPLLSFYSGDYVAIKSPYLPMAEFFDPYSLIPVQSLNVFSSADSLLARYGDEIVKNKELLTNEVQINFSPTYRLERIYVPASKSELQASYSKRGNLQQIYLKGMDNMTVKLIFDDFKQVRPEIIPLPRPLPNGKADFLNSLEMLDMKQLLKQFLK